MTIQKTIQKLRRAHRQREALFAAAHGNLALVKGLKDQAEALVEQGLLDEDLRPTESGFHAYASLAAPVVWGTSVTGVEKNFSRYLALPSADGRTVYAAPHGTSEPAVAFEAVSVPSHVLEAWGIPDSGREIPS